MSTRQDDAKRTRAALIAAATRLFVERGYFETSTEDLVEAAGVGTRGALYHHFESKRALFRAVFIDALERYAMRPITPTRSEAEPIERLRLGIQRFLDTATEPDVQRIVLIEAPTVLGWDELRMLEAPTVMTSLMELLDHAAVSGALRAQPTEALARVLLGMVQEAGLMMSRTDAEGALAVRAAIDDVVLGLSSAAD